MRAREIALAMLFLCAGSLPATAQKKGPMPSKASPAEAEAEPELKYEREFFLYPVGDRRDPFATLSAQDRLGPRFEDLTLRGVIHSREGRSVALLADPAGKVYRVRQGEIVGNARVVEIQPLQVLFAVDNFGVVRQERLEMKRKANKGVGG